MVISIFGSFGNAKYIYIYLVFLLYVCDTFEKISINVMLKIRKDSFNTLILFPPSHT